MPPRAPPPTPPPTPPASPTSLGPAEAWLRAAASGATLDAIVTFRSPAGLARLDRLGVRPTKLAQLPVARAQLTTAQAREVAAWPETRSVRPNRALRTLLDEAAPMVRATDVWAGRGVPCKATGDGVGIAVVDTGCDATHADLPYQGKVKVNAVVPGASGLGGPATKLQAEAPHTDLEAGHGTHVAGIAAGLGAAGADQFKGIAYHANVYAYRVGAGLSILPFAVLEAYDRILALVKEDQAAGRTPRIRVINNSWGGGDGEDHDPDDAVHIYAKEFHDRGVVVVFAAGNGGGPDKLNQYATSPHVVAVGAATKPDAAGKATLADFSSTGRPEGPWTRTQGGIYRPTVVAPGVDITAPRSATAPLVALETDPANPAYTTASGTSMAAPCVAGVVALMLEANPALTAAQAIAILERTAKPLEGHDVFEQGAGLVDAAAAVTAARAGAATPWTPPAYRYIERRRQPVQGKLLVPGFAVKDVLPMTVQRVPIEVRPGEHALRVRVAWGSPADPLPGDRVRPWNLYLFLHDPAGKLRASSAALLDTGAIRERTVMATNCAPGLWTLSVEGRVNGPVAFEGEAVLLDRVEPK